MTLSCAEGDAGRVYDGALPFAATDIDLGSLPKTRTAMMLNLASPAAAFRWWRLPAQGVGLARMEFIVSNLIKAHPMALLRFDQVQDREARPADRGADARLPRQAAPTSSIRWRAAWRGSPHPSTRGR